MVKAPEICFSFSSHFPYSPCFYSRSLLLSIRRVLEGSQMSRARDEELRAKRSEKESFCGRGKEKNDLALLLQGSYAIFVCVPSAYFTPFSHI